MLEWLRSAGCPLVVVANKLDKVKKSQREECLETVRRTLALTGEDTLIPFSAEDGTGRDSLLAALEALV
jgi:GTP-binding protein